MRFQVIHRTRYRYATPVKESFNEVRVQPVSNEHQAVENFILKVLPPPRLRHYVDFYHNCVHHFEIPEPHDSLLIESQFRATTNSTHLLELGARPFPRSRLAECARLERCFEFLQPTSYVEGSAETWKLALDIAGDEPDVWQAAQLLMRWVHRELAYTPQSTDVRTRSTQVLADRRGVCQDFAHLLLALCRTIDIPALYVSGYVFTPDTTATHAWVEVFLPGIGWRGLDPTHGCQPDERYIKLAVGRDYADAAPTRGHYRGLTQRTMEVHVSIEPLDAAAV
jgi:transglutaminase-like putative cysteine protease